MFVSEKDPCVRGVQENPCEYGYIIEDSVNNVLEDLFCRLDKRSKNRSAMDCVRLLEAIIRGNKGQLTKGSAKELYLELKE